MTYDLATLFGASLLEIRKKSTKTHDLWTEKTGMSQSYLSAAERGQSGWESLVKICTAIERAGVDPLELLRLVLAKADPSIDEERQELLSLWSTLDPVSREAVMVLLRKSERHSAAR